MKPKVIVTGFEPFSVYPINSSWQAAKLLANEEANTLVKELKVNHAEAHYQLLALLKENKADVLLLSGLADRDQIAVETKACKPVALHFVDGPDVLYGRWPWKESLTALERLHVPFGVSENAGKYVCESTYWSALAFRRLNGYPAYVGFMHVPVLSRDWTALKISAAMQTFIAAALAVFPDESRTGIQ